MGTLYSGHDPQNWAPGVTDSTTIEPNIRYSEDLWGTLTHFKNANRDSDGNAWGIMFPGGGWVSKGAISQLMSVGTRPHLFGAMTLDPYYGLQDVPIDWFAVRYALRVYGLQAPTCANLSPTTLMQTYEPTIEGGASANGPVSYAGLARTWLNDCQRAVQFIKRSATRFGIDPNRGFTAGESAGATNAMVAAMHMSRSYMPEGLATLRWDATHSSRVNGVLNLNGPASFNPYLVDVGIMGPGYGINSLAAMKRLCLIPASNGTFSDASLPTSFLKTFSPLELMQTNAARNHGLRISSWYKEADLSGGLPTAGVGHDPRSFTWLDDASEAAGVIHTGRRMVQTSFAGEQEMYETYALEMKADIDLMVG